MAREMEMTNTQDAVEREWFGNDERAPRIVAKTLYRLMKKRGVAHGDVLRIATALLGLVSDDLRRAA